jgi:hypothetical protein
LGCRANRASSRETPSTQRGGTLPTPPCGTVWTEGQKITITSRRALLEDQRGTGPQRRGGAAPQHIRGASPLTLKGGKMDGKKLKKRRMAKGFSRQRLARLSGVSAGEIAKAENGTLELRSPQAARLSAALRSSS